MPAPPEIFILAGPNGAGKTTCADVVLPRRALASNFVNADRILVELGHPATELTAGQEMLRRIKALRSSGKSFAFETTLAGKSHAAFLRCAIQDGYFVHLTFMALGSPELAKARVLDRVADGGHNIPPDVIERRYRRGLRNFFSVYRELAGAWALFDNSSSRPIIIARGAAGETTEVLDRLRYEEIYRHADHSS